MAESVGRAAVGRGAARALVLSLLAGAPGCIESFAVRDAAVDRPLADVAPCRVDDGGCWPAPRPVAPLSTATVTSHRPTLRWVLPPGAGARVELCRDRALTAGCVRFDATGTSGRPEADLDRGVWFWRLATRVGDVTTSAVGPVWQFTVGARAAPLDRAWGTTLDLDGDGLADVAVGAAAIAAAYVFLGGRDAASLPERRRTLTGPRGSEFGGSLRCAGDVDGDGYVDLIVGANRGNAAYVYLGGADAPAMDAPSITLAGPRESLRFGYAVAVAGDVDGDGDADVVVGAPDSNTAYVYRGGAGAAALREAPITLAAPDDGLREFGNAVAGLGDVDGDGYDDVLVSAYGSDRAYVYLGGEGETALGARPIVLTGAAGSGFGGMADGVGDVNGDGYADVAVNAFRHNYTSVYLGGPGPALLSAPAVTLMGVAAPANTAGGVGRAGDVDGDGFADVAVTSPVVNRVLVYRGGEGPAALRAAPIELAGPPGTDHFGSAVSGTGDVDGDGYGDLVVGALYSHNAFVYRGGATAPLRGTPITLAGSMGSLFGSWVASAPPRPRARRRRARGSPHLVPGTVSGRRADRPPAGQGRSTDACSRRARET